MRCPSCEKFVSYDTEAEPEENEEPTVEGNTFTAGYRRILPCGECGDELKALDMTVSQDLLPVAPEPVSEKGEPSAAWARFLPGGDEYDEGRDWSKCPGAEEEGEHDWELDVEVSATTGSIDKDRNGRAITNPRYRATTYGVEVTGTATCATCGATAEVSASESERASAFEEQV